MLMPVKPILQRQKPMPRKRLRVGVEALREDNPMVIAEKMAAQAKQIGTDNKGCAEVLICTADRCQSIGSTCQDVTELIRKLL